MFVYEQYAHSRGLFLQICLLENVHFDMTLTFTPIIGSGYDILIKRYTRSEYFDDFYGTDCHSELYRGFEQVEIALKYSYIH